MQEVKISKEELKALVPEFFGAVIHRRSKWTGKELPQIHRLFPCNIIAMFFIWYRAHLHLDEEVQITMDDARFLKYFRSALLEANYRWRELESKSDYTRSQGEFRFLFSSLRLTREGVRVYLELLNEGY